MKKKNTHTKKFKCYACGKPVFCIGLCKYHYGVMWRKNYKGKNLRGQHRKRKEEKRIIGKEIIKEYKELLSNDKKINMVYGYWDIAFIVNKLIKEKKIEPLDFYASPKAPKDYWDFIIKN